MCGENITSIAASIAAEGSPPHVRGKQMVTVTEPSAFGITPACAGKTCRNTPIIFMI